MLYPLRPALFALLLVPALGLAGAHAQDALTAPSLKTPKAAKPKTTTAAASSKERRPGELEGWDSGVTAPLKKKGNRPADALSEKAVPDGGLPLPERAEKGQPLAPAGFDKNGNLGSTFRF